MRIAVLSNELLPITPKGGALERLAWGWSAGLARDNEVYLITFSHHRDLLETHDSSKLTRVFIEDLGDLDLMLRDLCIDQLILHNRPHWALATSLPSLTICHNFADAWSSDRDPIPPHQHITQQPDQSSYQYRRVTAVSHSLLAHARARLQRQQRVVEVLTPYLDEAFLRPDSSAVLPGQRSPLLFPNRLMVKKGVIETIEALKTFGAGEPLVDFIDNISPNAHPNPEQLDLLHRIADEPRAALVITQHTPQATAQLYRQYAAVITPSIYPEGCGLVPLEALALGVPAACSAAGALSEIAPRLAPLLDPMNPHSFATTLLQLSTGTTVGEDIRDEIVERFSFTRSLQQLTRLLED